MYKQEHYYKPMYVVTIVCDKCGTIGTSITDETTWRKPDIPIGWAVAGLKHYCAACHKSEVL